MRMNNRLAETGGGILPTFCQVITLYNKYFDDEAGETRWRRTVLENCCYRAVKAEAAEDGAVRQTDTYEAFIAKNDAFLPEKKWTARPDKTKHFTLKTGDLIFLGETAFQIDGQSGMRANGFINKYKPDCFTIKSVTDNTTVALAAHYYVSGV